MVFAWSVIDGIVHGPDLLLADGGEAGALGETLTNQPVGVPVAAAPMSAAVRHVPGRGQAATSSTAVRHTVNNVDLRIAIGI